MEIENRNGEGNVSFIISGIEGDMGERATMTLIQQADGDVLLRLSDDEAGRSEKIEFCSSNGGGRRPIIAQRLRDLIRDLMAGGPPRPTFTQIDSGEAAKLWQSAEGMIKNPIKKSSEDIYKQALEDDATDLWNVTNEIRKEIKRHEWICEGRGPYSYDDDEYREETRRAFDAILGLIEGVQRPASNRFHKIVDGAHKKEV